MRLRASDFTLYQFFLLIEVDVTYTSTYDLLFFHTLFFLEQFWVHSKTEQKVQHSYIPLAPYHTHNLSHYQYSPPY